MEKCRGGSSLVNCSELVQAVIEYMKDNYPNNPEEFNFQAELQHATGIGQRMARHSKKARMSTVE